jgi:hypothetical protein
MAASLRDMPPLAAPPIGVSARAGLFPQDRVALDEGIARLGFLHEAVELVVPDRDGVFGFGDEESGDIEAGGVEDVDGHPALAVRLVGPDEDPPFSSGMRAEAAGKVSGNSVWSCGGADPENVLLMIRALSSSVIFLGARSLRILIIGFPEASSTWMA